MTKSLSSFLFAALISVALSAPPELVRLKERMDVEKEAALKPLYTSYLKALSRLEAKFTKVGDLDAALAVRAESSSAEKVVEGFASQNEPAKAPAGQTDEPDEKRKTGKPLVLTPGKDHRVWWKELPELEVYGLDLVGQRNESKSCSILVSAIIDGKLRDLAKIDGADFPVGKSKKTLVEVRKFKVSGDLHLFFKSEGDAIVTLLERNLKATTQD